MGIAVRVLEEVAVDVGSAAKPTGSLAPSGPVRFDAVATRQAVPTELPSSQSVSASTETVTTRNDAARLPKEASVTHDVVVDPANREAIYYRGANAPSGGVVTRAPDRKQVQLAYTQSSRRGRGSGRPRTQDGAGLDLQV
jgi:hypothetical protein